MQVNDKISAPSASSPGKESLVPTEYEDKWTPKNGLGALEKTYLPSSYQETNHDF